MQDLSDAQRKMLSRANRRYGKLTPGGNEAHFTTIHGAGQAATAKVLMSLGLGAYVSDGYGALFWISEKGHEVAEAAR